MELVNIFPIPVGKFHLNRSLKQDEIEFLSSQDQKPNRANSTSIDTYALNKPVLFDLKLWIHSCLKSFFFNVYMPKHPAEIYITQSWVNYTKKGESHHKHFHKNSILSAVFYVKSNMNSGNIVFYKNETGPWDIPASNYNDYNTTKSSMPVGDLDLVVFPSYLMHSVEPVTTEETRISLALNTFMRGTFGEQLALTELVLK